MMGSRGNDRLQRSTAVWSLVLASCVLVVASVQGIQLPHDCVNGGASSIGTCVTGQVLSGEKLALPFTVSLDDYNSNINKKALQVYLWNVNQEAGAWTTLNPTPPAIQTPASDMASNVPTVHNFDRMLLGTTTGAAPVTTAFMLTSNIGAPLGTPLCVGRYQVIIDRLTKTDTLNYALYIRWGPLLTPFSPPLSLAPGQSMQLPQVVLPGDTIDVYIDADFNARGHSTRQLAAAVETSSDLSKEGLWAWQLLGAGALGGQPINTRPFVANRTTATSITNLAPSLGQAHWSLTAPTFSVANFPTGYDWAAKGPFLNTTITMGGAVEWQELRQNVTYTLYAGDTNMHLKHIVAQYRPDPLWWRLRFGSAVSDISASPFVDNAPLTVYYAPYNSVTGDPYDPSSYQAPGSGVYDTVHDGVFNPAFYDPTAPSGRSVASPVFFGAGTRRYTEPLLFLGVPSDCDGTALLHATLTPVEESVVEGECSSYTQCNPEDSGDHPSQSRAFLSANDEVQRLQHCALVTGFGTAETGFEQTPVTRCIECTSDCECGEGQYCFADEGVCTDSSTQVAYVCDPWANKRLGLCRTKSSDVLGEWCRTDEVQPLQPSTNVYTASLPPTPDIPVMAETAVRIAGVDGISDSDDQSQMVAKGVTGYGFCGEVRYYNNSHALPGYTLVAAQQVRSVLWQGRCFNHECHECRASSVLGELPDATYTSCQATRTCINGRLMDNVAVDFLPRTFSHNTIAGTILAAIFAIILAQCMVACRIAADAKRAGRVPQRVIEQAKQHKQQAAARSRTWAGSCVAVAAAAMTCRCCRRGGSAGRGPAEKLLGDEPEGAVENSGKPGTRAASPLLSAATVAAGPDYGALA